MNSFFTAGIIIDIVIAVILILNITLGARRGFVKTVYSFLRTIIAFAAAYIFTKPLAAILRGTQIYKDLTTRLETSLQEYFAEKAEIVLPEAFSEGAPEILSFFEKFGRTPQEITEEYSRLAAEQSADAVERTVQYIITPACELLLNVLCFIAIFLVSLLVLFLLMNILNLLANVPIIKGLNKLLGAVSGAIVAVIFIFILIMLFDAALPYLEGLDIGISAAAVSGSKLYTLFKVFNPFAMIMAITSKAV